MARARATEVYCATDKKLRLLLARPHDSGRALVVAGLKARALEPVPGRIFPLAETAAAHR